ncbi:MULTISPECIES: Holliday junction resolvase RuvX [Acidiphilium]|jgi:putative Holliday junction resolvase|uniref:Putative pre-16S rRNA nuclease n=1 Tax=Acidiphilium cryptum (strain JF-5) TaxID=349163 RepID=YQGF_ACICJ|nr:MULTISPECIES: Holliday junction resolvase RuvX [Acidiphilium]A5FWW0.1 RecName: Full=Putative pre-16S rRNA nuclease [Acidiphilium cryptum JF-5]MBU6357971.1 Holliday junction resolvase RuvX [Rhodospirillales bacterium]ABQ30092.1 Holliday junction resolvase YqgF [Acidiphilium cryptum JF-5]EGO93924.1 Putative Holliday junction resolvase [Acidiphilium sp. PM]MBS3024594.1 Holliday junction resolvase RuvX [Acidiphilium multivorum]UNC15752.1 Holliday junction resolvase RuvX [Acidiphilium multivoru
MTLFNLTDLASTLPRNARLIGLDPGSKIIGIALSDVGRRLATPYGAMKRGKLAEAAATILDIARKEGAAALIIGLPLSMDGSIGPAAQAARDWAHAIARETGLPVAMMDERLSSAAVNRALIEADVTRAKRAGRVDAAAASYMLQGALDLLNEPRPEE